MQFSFAQTLDGVEPAGQFARLAEVMDVQPQSAGPWADRPPTEPAVTQCGPTAFRQLFENNSDPSWLLDPTNGQVVDCNAAALQLLAAPSKQHVLHRTPAELSPPLQPDGSPSRDKARAIMRRSTEVGALRFEWTLQRFDRIPICVEGVSTAIPFGDRLLHFVVTRDLSDQLAAERALDDSRQFLHSIADNIEEAIYRSDAQHRLIFVNPAYLRMFGYRSLAELQSIPRERLYARGADRHHLLALLDRHGTFQAQEIEYVRKDGSHFWGLASSTAIRHPSAPHVAYHVGVITDVTERRRINEEIRRLNRELEQRILERTAQLQASEALARTLVDHAPEAIVVFDGATGRFVSCNTNATRLYGLPPETLLTLTALDVSPPFQPDGRSSLEASQEKIAEALAGGTPVFEWCHQRPDGHSLPCEVRLIRLPIPGQSLLRASILDNSERRRRERIQQATFEISEAVHMADDLASLYARIHSIIQGLMPARNFYIALYDPDAETISFPYYVDELSPPPGPRAVGTGLTGYILRTGKPLLVDAALNARKRRVGNAVTFDGLADVSYVESGQPAAIWLGVPLNLQGRPIGVMAVQDYRNPVAYGEQEKQILTFVAEQTALAIQRKQAEQALHQALAREKELSELRSRFVSMVSHEFRTPLGILLSSAEILTDYFDRLDSGERQAHLLSIQNNIRRMAQLMEEVLLLSRLDAGKLEFQPALTDLPSLCRALRDEILTATRGKCPIEFSVLPPTPLPPASTDERLLRHIFLNLLGNAVKYSAPNHPIHWTLAPAGAHAVWTLRDQGIGIPPADQKWLFQSFYRGTNVTDQPGTGLGLVIVKRCIDLHGGQITIQSQLNQGTTVTVTLPVFSSAPSAPPSDPSRP